MPKTVDYIVWKNGSTYYAGDGTTGVVTYSGSAFHTVINNAIAALTTGGTILVKPGTYVLTATVTLADNIHIMGYGAKLTTTDNTLKFFTIEGSAGAAHNLTSVKYGTNIVSIANSSNVTVGDYLLLYSDDLFHALLGTSKIGSIHKVNYLPDGTTIELDETVPFNYATTPVIQHLVVRHDITIEGLELIGFSSTADENHFGIYAHYATELNFRNLKITNCSSAGFSFYDVTNTIIEGCRVSGSHRDGYGYGIAVNDASHGIIVSDCVFTDCRHCTDNGKGETYGIPYSITYSHCRFSYSDAERQHGQGMAIGYDACTFDNVGAIVLEVPDTFLTNCHIRGIRFNCPGSITDQHLMAIEVGHSQANCINARICNNIIEYNAFESAGAFYTAICVYYGPNGLISGNTIRLTGIASTATAPSAILIAPTTAFDNITVTNNTIDTVNQYGVRVVPGAALSKVRITDNYITAVDKSALLLDGASAAITDFVIRGNVLKSTSDKALYILATASDGVIQGNIMRTSVASGSALCIYAGVHAVSIIGNVIYSTDDGLFLNGNGAGTPSYDIVISGNKIATTETSSANGAIKLIYSHDVVITGNSLTMGSGTKGIFLSTNAIDIKLSNNIIVGTLADWYSVDATAVRSTIDGIGLNGAADPDSAGDWSTHDNERIAVKWNNGATHYMSWCVAGVWYDVTIV
jgi:hypothetical protein